MTQATADAEEFTRMAEEFERMIALVDSDSHKDAAALLMERTFDALAKPTPWETVAAEMENLEKIADELFHTYPLTANNIYARLRNLADALDRISESYK